MADAMNVFKCSVRVHDSELYVAICFREECLLTCCLDLVTIFWVYPLEPLLPCGYALFWIEAENSEHFLRPIIMFAASAIDSATARQGQPLRFCQIVFTSMQGFLGL